MAERIEIAVRVIPRSKANRVDAQRAGRFVIRVAAAPEAGAANRAAAALLATALGVRATDVRLERGSTSRDKSFSIPNVARDALSSLLTSSAAGGTAAGHVREARVPGGPSAATASRSRITGEGALSEHAQSRDRTRRGAAQGG